MQKNHQNGELEFRECQNYLCFESLSVKIGIQTNTLTFLNKFRTLLPVILPIEWKEASEAKAEHWFSVVKGKKSTGTYSVFKKSELLIENDSIDEILNLLESQIRSTIAE